MAAAEPPPSPHATVLPSPLFLVGGSTDNSPASDRDDYPPLTGCAVEVFDAVARPNHIRYPHVLQPGSATADRFLAGSVTSISFQFGPFEPWRFTPEAVPVFVAGELTLVLASTAWALARQRHLRRRLAR